MNISPITFDPELHVYTDSATGEIIPSVTQILQSAGHIDCRWFTAEARDRGSAVHTLCERYAKGERADTLGRRLDSLEFVNAFAAWMRETRAYLIASECIVSHTLNGKRYAGKFDGIYEIPGRGRILVDVKTGSRAKWHPIQLVAYSLAVLPTGEKVNPDFMMDLYVKANGTFRESYVTGIEAIEAIDAFKESLR